MKRILIFLMVLAVVIPAMAVTPKVGASGQNESLDWDYYVRDGDTTQITTERDTLSAVGALDTLVTRYYANQGESVSLTLDCDGGTTNRYKAIVQTLDRGDQVVADSNFVDRFWLHYAGAGDDSSFVETVCDSILTGGRSSGIFLPPLSVYAWRVKVITLSTQTGTPRFRFDATIWKK